MSENNPFWKYKKLSQMNDQEWESLCDGCGLCCYRKIIDGYFWKKKILNTKVACDLLDCKTCRCTQYQDRFLFQKECIKLNRKKIKEFKWLPETCAYRRISLGMPLPEWHPLVTGDPESTLKSGITIQDGINERDAQDLYDYVI